MMKLKVNYLENLIYELEELKKDFVLSATRRGIDLSINVIKNKIMLLKEGLKY